MEGSEGEETPESMGISQAEIDILLLFNVPFY
jgi:hypothetical protein